jgi:hypothetical protein
MLVGAVGIELKATLKARKLLIPLKAENVKNSEFAQRRYAPGTREPPDKARLWIPLGA